MKVPEIPEEIINAFGNLIAIRETNEKNFFGIPEVFVSSIIQFQPLLEIEFYLESGQKLNFTKIFNKKTPIAITNIYSNKIVQLHEELIVDNNDLSYNIKFYLNKNYDKDKLKIIIKFSGAVLFSPQGVPYHWLEEKLIDSEIFEDNKIHFIWRDKLYSAILFPQKVTWLDIRSINDDLIEKRKYFSSFNIKDRFTHWVDHQVREALLNPEETRKHSKGRNLVYGGEAEVEIDKVEVKSYIIAMTVLENNEEKQNTSHRKSYDLKETKIKNWNDFISKVPIFYSENKDLEALYYKSWFVLFSNKMKLNEKRLMYPFTSVNKFHYYNHFLWDSAFHAFSWLWFNDQTHAESELKNFILNQWRNGMIPYELFIFEVNGREWMETDFLTTAATQPPVLGISIMEIYNKFGNESFLSFFYEPLLKYEEWLWKYRDMNKRGLSYCYHIWESGCDNSPKFDSIAKNRLLDPPLEDVNFNIFLYIMRKNLIKMAEILGKKPPSYLKDRINLTKNSMNNIMYDEDDHVYYDLIAGSEDKIKIKIFSSILPLITDIPDRNKRNILINSYLLSEKEFNTPCPVPSVSWSEASFDSNDFWRGATWPQITWTFIYGTKKYNQAAASIILSKFLDKTAKNNFCNEYFDSIYGTSKNAGLPFQGWGTLYIDLILRHLIGLEPLGKGFRFVPLDTNYNRFGITNLLINGIEIDITRKEKSWEILLNKQHQIILSKTIPFKLIKEDDCFKINFEKNYNPNEVLIRKSQYIKEGNRIVIKLN